MKKIGSVYLKASILILLGAVLDYKSISGDRSIFIRYPGELVVANAAIGIIFIILLIIWRIQRRIESRIFFKQMVMLIIGIGVPSIFLYLMVAQLH